MEAVLLEVKDGIAEITLNRPSAMNAMNTTLLEESLQAFTLAEQDPSVRVVVLTGAGKAFCAGGDLPYFRAELKTTPQVRHLVALAGGLAQKIINLRQPVIAMVNGVAAGAGANLAIACDLVLAATTARFAQSFVKVGLVPDDGGTYLLPRRVGLLRAKELMFTGKMIDAQTALDYGMLNHIYQPEELRAKTWELATELASGPPLSIAAMKRMLNSGVENNLAAALEIEANTQSVLMMSVDGQEGMTSFAEKRAPKFIGQ